MKNQLNRPLRWSLLGLGMMIAVSLGQSSARGELLFSDSFQYSAGPLNGQGPPAGAPPGQTGWTATGGNPQVVASGLTFPHILSAGGAASLYGGTTDHATANLTPVTSGVVWIGYLIALQSGNDDGYAVLNVGGFTTAAPGYGLLYERGVFGIDNDTGLSHSQAFTTIAPSSTPQWLVVRLDFTTGTELLYVDPTTRDATPAARLRMTSTFKAAGFDQVILGAGYNTGQWIYDEVRVGTRLEDVVGD